MSVFACGLNTSQQILAAGPSILCCPSPVCLPTGITAASVAFSHILWKTDSGWRWTGHDAESCQEGMHIKSSWKIYACENRLAAISDNGSVLVWRKEWRTLHFQKLHLGRRLDENKLEDENHTNDKEKKSTDSDILEPKLSEVVYENTKCTKEQINSCNEVCRKEKCKDQEGANKKLKVEHSAEGKDKASCDIENTEIRFSKVAIEDNLLLALDTDGVMYWGNISVPLRMKVSDVAVGKEHCMALTAAGDVITWGNGMRGQLGIGELCHAEKPVPVESLQGVCITTITCGAWHCAALSESGDLYVWGWNETGQLGFPYKSESSHPLFHFFEHSCQCPKSSSFSHGYSPGDSDQSHHMGDKSQDKEVVYKDEENKEQKGNSKRVPDERINPEKSQEAINVQALPRLLDFWRENVNIHDIQCGDRHTLFMLQDGSVWSVGMNRYGQLGLGHIEAVKEPCEVFRRGISAIHAGGWNSIFISSRNHPAPLKV